MRDLISLYSNVGFISKGYEDIASKSTEGRRFRFFDAPSPGNPVNIRITLEYLSYICPAESTISIQIFLVGSERHYFETECVMAVQTSRSQKVVYFGTNESAYATS